MVRGIGKIIFLTYSQTPKGQECSIACLKAAINIDFKWTVFGKQIW